MSNKVYIVRQEGVLDGEEISFPFDKLFETEEAALSWIEEIDPAAKPLKAVVREIPLRYVVWAHILEEDGDGDEYFKIFSIEGSEHRARSACVKLLPRDEVMGTGFYLVRSDTGQTIKGSLREIDYFPDVV